MPSDRQDPTEAVQTCQFPKRAAFHYQTFFFFDVFTSHCPNSIVIIDSSGKKLSSRLNLGYYSYSKIIIFIVFSDALGWSSSCGLFLMSSDFFSTRLSSLFRSHVSSNFKWFA